MNLTSCNDSTHENNRWVFFLLIAAISALIYSNTLNASWHFDDLPNIIENEKLHLKDLSLSSLWQTFVARPDMKSGLYRPVACLSLALNWFAHGDRVMGYHMVNIAIHMICSFFLYLSIFELLKAPKLSSRLSVNEHIHFIAGLATVLWTVHPIQTQAITYIVQRMASMAAMFYIIGFWLYVRLRRPGTSITNQVWMAVGVGVCYILALGTKENTVVFPLTLIITEFTFFSEINLTGKRKLLFYGGIGGGCCLLIAGAVWLLADPSYLQTYQIQRPFTPGQRLLTQTRVIMLYLKQLFYPIPAHLSFQHHMPISTSLWQPWTTFPAITAVVMMVGLGGYLLKKRTLTGFAIVFYFLNHLVESTFLPLELVFEHRNYLPSMFLFVPIAMGFNWLVNVFYNDSKGMRIVLIGFGTLVIFGIGFGSYIRNMAWQSEKSLWEDVLTKNPSSGRAYQILAEIFKTEGQLDKALTFYEISLNFIDQESRPHEFKIDSFNNMGSLYIARGDYEQAINLFEQAIALNPTYPMPRYNLGLTWIFFKQWDKALEQIEYLLSLDNTSAQILNLKGYVLIQLGKPDQALMALRKAIHTHSMDRRLWTNMGKALMDQGQYRRAELYLKQARYLNPTMIHAPLLLAENRFRSGDLPGALVYMGQVFDRFSVFQIGDALKGPSSTNPFVQYDPNLLLPIFQRKADEMTVSLLADPKISDSVLKYSDRQFQVSRGESGDLPNFKHFVSMK